MRLATLFDISSQKATTVFVLPGGQRVGLIDVVHYAPPGASFENFENLAGVASHLDIVLPAIRQWRQVQPPLSSISSPGIRFLPPVPAPRTFRVFDAFENHARAWRSKLNLEFSEAWLTQPAFHFGNSATLVGHEAPVCCPRDCRQFDYGLALGVVIGRGGKNIAAQDAWKHIAGFTIINDFSIRQLERLEMQTGLGPGKSRDFATAVGPYLVTLDDLADRIDLEGHIHLTMTARLNGKQTSRGNASTMFFSWPQLIEHASRDVELSPGDLMCSGTIGGGSILEAGPDNTGGWLKPGDTIELEIERLGVLRTPIVEQPGSRMNASLNAGGALVEV